MNRQDFTSLPLSLALGAIWDALHEHGDAGMILDDMPAPKRAGSPKYDSAIYRREGVTYASEYDAEGLRFWQRRAADSAAGGGQYAEQDAKQAKALGFWIAWREQNPGAVWSGERNREQVTAAAPSAKPTVYPRNGGATKPAAPSGGGYSDADYGADDDSDIPF